MKVSSLVDQRKVWRPQQIANIELAYRHSSFISLPRHFHEELEMTVMQESNWNFYYRGTKYIIPAGIFTLTQPGEVHQAYSEKQVTCTFRGLRFDSILLEQIVEEITGKPKELPYFSNPVITDKTINQLAFAFYKQVETETTFLLEQQSLLFKLLEKLILEYSSGIFISKTLGCECQPIKQVKNYLNDNFTQNISLEELADIANLSPYYLNRAFSKEVGLPPHTYQTQVRIARAKTLLNQNWSIAQVATETGFSSQSHFGWHFKKVVGVTPGSYIKKIK